MTDEVARAKEIRCSSPAACSTGPRARRVETNSSSRTRILRWLASSSIFLRRYFDLNDEIRITCRLYADHLARQKEVEDFWLETLALPRTALRKSVVNVYSKYSKRRRVGNLPYGTCHVVVSRTWLTQTIFGAIQEIGGFTREAWLE
jgi:hypothetical protein